MTSERIITSQQLLGFDYDEGHGEHNLTALASIPLLLQAFRSLDLPRGVGRHVCVKQRQRGLDEASYVESFVILSKGICLEMGRKPSILPWSPTCGTGRPGG